MSHRKELDNFLNKLTQKRNLLMGFINVFDPIKKEYLLELMKPFDNRKDSILVQVEWAKVYDLIIETDNYYLANKHNKLSKTILDQATMEIFPIIENLIENYNQR